jgi:nucleolar protein 15
VATTWPKCSLSHPDSLKSLSTGPEWESSDEESVEKKSVAVKTKDEKFKKSRSSARKAASKKKSAEVAANTSSVLYIGHLPPHFEEHELVQFLKQFGKVLNLRVSRSKKTGNSKGFAFVQMQSPGIAAIVADTLTGYIMFGQRRLVCHVVPPEKIHKKLFFRQKRIVKEKQATEKPLGMMKAITSRLVAREHKKRETLKELGIDYDFPGYAAAKTEDVVAAVKKTGKSTPKDSMGSTENKSKKSKLKDSLASVESTESRDSSKGTKRKDSLTSVDSADGLKKRRNVSDAPSPIEAKVSFKQPERKSKRTAAAKPAVPQSEKKKPKKETKSKTRRSSVA